jgi:hypothetical protein
MHALDLFLTETSRWYVNQKEKRKGRKRKSYKKLWTLHASCYLWPETINGQEACVVWLSVWLLPKEKNKCKEEKEGWERERENEFWQVSKFQNMKAGPLAARGWSGFNNSRNWNYKKIWGDPNPSICQDSST